MWVYARLSNSSHFVNQRSQYSLSVTRKEVRRLDRQACILKDEDLTYVLMNAQPYPVQPSRKYSHCFM